MNLFLIRQGRYYFSILFLFITISSFAQIIEVDTVANQPKEEKKLPSFRFVPTNYMTQFAGSIGLVSAGFGWDYSKNKRWSTDFLVGFTPKYDSERAKVTFTLRQSYTPWKVPVKNNIDYHPLRTGMFVSTTAGRQFWLNAPDKYPTNYYTFSTKVRFNLFVGQEVSYMLKSKTSYFDRVKFYYDVHTSDFYLISRVQNGYLQGKDYLGLALGVKLHIRK